MPTTEPPTIQEASPAQPAQSADLRSAAGLSAAAAVGGSAVALAGADRADAGAGDDNLVLDVATRFSTFGLTVADGSNEAFPLGVPRGSSFLLEPPFPIGQNADSDTGGLNKRELASWATESASAPWLSRLNAWFFDKVTGYANFIARDHKHAALSGIEAGRILEIGAGTGANFAYIPPASTVIALEPNLAMHERLHRRANDHDIDLQILNAPAEEMPLPNNSVDTVIITLVLCTIDNPGLALQEVKRVLRAGGTMRFVEHVAAQPHSPRRLLQRALTRPWAWIFEGCQLNRHTAQAIESAGFASVRIQRQRFRQSIFVPVNIAIHGIAIN